MRTEILFVLDRSGSMQSIRDEVIGGFNAFVDEQKKQPGEAYVTVAQFDSGGYDITHLRKPLGDTPHLTRETFVPRGMTPLLDAIGRTVVEQGHRFDRAAADEKPEKVVLVVITDGQENSSKEYRRAQVFDMLKRQQDQWNWTVTYIGANQDAIGEANSLGIAAGNALNFAANAGGVKGVMRAMNASVLHSRSTGGSYQYTAADRAASMDSGDLGDLSKLQSGRNQ